MEKTVKKGRNSSIELLRIVCLVMIFWMHAADSGVANGIGAWSLQTKPMYKEYFFVATRDAAALDRALAQLSFGCRIAGSRERAYMPMPDDAQDWYRSVLDDDGVVRNSVARIEDGVLHIEQGPLVGQEARVKKIDRHKRWCLVDVGDGDSAFRELLPLDVPSKT